MNLSCDKRCSIMNTLINLKCRGCFGVEVNREAEGGACDCKITINSEKTWGWD